eukprot:296622-Amphidinium_carterae.1
MEGINSFCYFSVIQNCHRCQVQGAVAVNSTLDKLLRKVFQLFRILLWNPRCAEESGTSPAHHGLR